MLTDESRRPFNPPVDWDKTPRFALVVDDDPFQQMIASETLRGMGYTSVTANDGAEGVRAFEKLKDQIQVVVSDYNMPGMNGDEVVRHIRQTQITGLEPVIIVASKQADEGEHHRVKATCLAAGANDYVEKGRPLPEFMMNLRSTVEKHLKRPPSGPVPSVDPDPV